MFLIYRVEPENKYITLRRPPQCNISFRLLLLLLLFWCCTQEAEFKSDWCWTEKKRVEESLFLKKATGLDGFILFGSERAAAVAAVAHWLIVGRESREDLNKNKWKALFIFSFFRAARRTAFRHCVLAHSSREERKGGDYMYNNSRRRRRTTI